jgi:CBS domain-containing protein
MKVADAMTRDVRLVSPDDSLEAIAKIMATEDLGFLPVGENDRLVGTITDRDIVVRGLARGMGGDAHVRDAMSEDVKYCYEDAEMVDVMQNMGSIQVRRLPVVNRDKRLVGVVSLADAALKDNPESVGVAMSSVVEPGGSHT